MISAFVASVLASAWPYLLGLVLAALGGGGLYLKGRGDGKSIAKTDSLKRDVATRDELLEMHRDASAAEREAAAMSEAAARERADKWARR